MRHSKAFGRAVVLAALLIFPVERATAMPQETIASVVSVLPVWPGRAQGGSGGPPGVAPEGSGVVVQPDIIATAWHVIEPAERIDIRLSDGRVLPAELVAQDVASDIALLRVNADLPPMVFAESPSLADHVCAIGNAYGFGLSVTCGVVSALGVSNAGFNPVEDFVQTDAAANPGTSGGALVDDEGHLVGMISAIFASGSETNIGMNFAVSAPLLQRVTAALLAEGEVSYPQPGWRLALPERSVLARIAAAEVALLDDSGPAAQAGFQVGDLILSIGERRIRAPRDAIAALALVPEGTPSVDVRIERNGTPAFVSLPLARPKVADEQATNRDQLGDCPHVLPVCLMRQAVFPVSAFDPLGSATRISDTLLVTNRHVIGDRPDAVVYTPDGPRGARVVPTAYTGDLALLEVTGLPEDGFVPDLESDGVLESTEFYAVGADIARQEVRVFDPGPEILPPADAAPLGRLHVAARMQPGVSGGALVDAQGSLRGIAVGGGDGRFEAIPVGDVRAALALREDDQAAAVTARLGGAFARCADLLAGSVPESGAIVDVCSTAQNHGQLLEAGRILARIGDVDGAVGLHRSAVDQVPNSINARISLLVSLQLGARFEEMTEHARWLTEVASDDPQALRFAIQSGVWGGDPELAEAGFQALLTADPRQAEAARRFIDAAPPRPPRR